MGKKVLFGCLASAVLVVLVGVIAAVIVIPRLFTLAQKEIASQIEQEGARRKASQGWQVPAKDAAADELFPPQVATLSRVSADDDAALSVFEFNPPGQHATYRSGNDEVDVFVYHVPDLERQALLRRMKDAYDVKEGGMKVRTEMDYRAYTYLEGTQYHIWWKKGCVVVVRTKAKEDQEPFVNS